MRYHKKKLIISLPVVQFGESHGWRKTWRHHLHPDLYDNQNTKSENDMLIKHISTILDDGIAA